VFRVSKEKPTFKDYKERNDELWDVNSILSADYYKAVEQIGELKAEINYLLGVLEENNLVPRRLPFD